jgi:hypothetical protein
MLVMLVVLVVRIRTRERGVHLGVSQRRGQGDADGYKSADERAPTDLAVEICVD